MVNKQPEALRLADKLEQGYVAHETVLYPASDELRRLHESSTELLAALKEAHTCILGDHWGNALDVLAYAINKAERTTT